MSARGIPGPIGLDAFQWRADVWAEATLRQATPGSIVAHRRREVEELAALAHLGPAGARAAGGGEEEEAADCFLLLLHDAHRRGFSLLDAADREFTEHTLRRWGKPDAEGVVEQVREEG